MYKNNKNKLTTSIMNIEIKGIRNYALDILKYNNIDILQLFKEKLSNEPFQYSMNNVTHTYKCTHAGKYHFLSVKINEDYLLVLSSSDE